MPLASLFRLIICRVSDILPKANFWWRALSCAGFSSLLSLGSPTIEHVMQTFSNLFSRIGLDDPDPQRIGALLTDCCASEGAPTE